MGGGSDCGTATSRRAPATLDGRCRRWAQTGPQSLVGRTWGSRWWWSAPRRGPCRGRVCPAFPRPMDGASCSSMSSLRTQSRWRCAPSGSPLRCGSTVPHASTKGPSSSCSSACGMPTGCSCTGGRVPASTCGRTPSSLPSSMFSNIIPEIVGPLSSRWRERTGCTGLGSTVRSLRMSRSGSCWPPKCRLSRPGRGICTGR
mmetsp:Transcript_26017/g.46940  ORF Transcript_26017/g.46940 Transcript_26017/m.46940 type:complete len:201 (-) Transcript_26017:132-734(-)